MKIWIDDIIEVWKKYTYLCEEWYFNRKYSISRIYDHFFAKLFFRITKVKKSQHSKDFEVSFSKNINHCSNDFFEVLEVWKPDISFSTRVISIPNLYDTIRYEVLTHKIYNELIWIFNNKENLHKELINDCYFGFAHRVDLTKDKIFYEHYLDGWLEFDNTRADYIEEYKYYIETDVKSFYDTINHDILIRRLNDFLKDNISEGSKTEKIDELMFEMSKILYKVSGFTKIWIPQWLVASDMIAQAYLWLIFYSNQNITHKNNAFTLKNTSSRFLIYADDIVIFSKSEKNIYKWFKLFKDILSLNGLTLNLAKTSQIKSSWDYNNIPDISITKIRQNNTDEINKLIVRIVEILSHDNLTDINTGELKKLFKWLWKIRWLEQDNIDEHIKNLLRNALKFTSKDLVNNKKISLLIVISPSNFLTLLDIVNSYNIRVSNNENLETSFVESYLQEADLYIPLSNLIFLYLDLKDRFWVIWKAIKNKVYESNNYSLIDLINSEWSYLKSNLKRNNLYKLYCFLYRDIFNKDGEWENIIGVKINAIFDIEADITSILSDNINYLYINKIISSDNLNRLSEILDNLLILKMTHKIYYLEDAWFLSDLYSLFNLLITLLHSIEQWRPEQVKISAWNSIFNEIKGWEKLEKIAESHKNLLYYLTKRRALYNHKEIDVKINDSIALSSLKDRDIFLQNIQKCISDIFKEINEVIKLKY